MKSELCRHVLRSVVGSFISSLSITFVCFTEIDKKRTLSPEKADAQKKSNIQF